MSAIVLWQACVLGVCLSGAVLCCIGMFVVVYWERPLPRELARAAEPTGAAAGRQVFSSSLQHGIA
jgi:hypothetical protein